MSEKIYSWLLRLYPSEFCEKYGGEALQLFRDRVRDETGFWPSVRLWFDVLLDLAVSLPQEYLYLRPEFVGATPLHSANGVPSFYFLQSEPLRPAALLFGGLISSLAILTFSILLSHPGRPAGAATIGQIRGESGISQAQSQQSDTRDAESEANRRELGGIARLDAAERWRVVNSAATILKKYYVEQEIGQRMADALVAHEKNGDDDGAANGTAFAALLTRQIRDVNPDRHLTVDYREAPLPERPSGPTVEEMARYREMLQEQNCTFEDVRVLAHNIGYLKLNSFPDVSVCRETAEAAMAAVNGASAIIFDLRENRGGDPAMVMLVAAYLFDHPEYMYNPRENATEQNWTHSPVSESKLADKPVYILTSPSTFSAAEHFSYDLKMLRRASIVGETTAGAAHSGVWHRIDDHFGVGVPEVKAINPFSTADWAEVGVEPDVKVHADEALKVAEELAKNKVWKK
jgi:hypothetical protein